MFAKSWCSMTVVLRTLTLYWGNMGLIKLGNFCKWLENIRFNRKKSCFFPKYVRDAFCRRSVCFFLSYSVFTDLQYWSLLNWRNFRFQCGCVAVLVNWFFVIILSCFAIFKNVVRFAGVFFLNLLKFSTVLVPRINLTA